LPLRNDGKVFVGAKAGWWLLIGGALVGVGSFMPWIAASTIFGTVTQSGMSGDGVFTLAAGVIIGFVGGMLLSGSLATRFTRSLLWTAIVLVTLVWIFDFIDIRNRVELVDTAFSTGSVGYGMWLMAVGAVVAVGGAANVPTTGTRSRDA
jgi:hypothetical protein